MKKTPLANIWRRPKIFLVCRYAMKIRPLFENVKKKILNLFLKQLTFQQNSPNELVATVCRMVNYTWNEFKKRNVLILT